MDYPTDKALSGPVDPDGIDRWWFRAIELQLAAAVSVVEPKRLKPPTFRSRASELVPPEAGQLFVSLSQRRGDR